MHGADLKSEYEGIRRDLVAAKEVLLKALDMPDEGDFDITFWAVKAAQRIERLEGTKTKSMRKWYVGTRNDAIFIIDQPPRPAPIDYLTEGDPDTNVIANMGAGTREICDLADRIIEAHNAAIAALSR